MTEGKKEGVLLRKTSLDFENESDLNPGVISDGDPEATHFKVCLI